MKTMTLILLLAVCALPIYSQNITNTLGIGGIFTIKDGAHNYMTLSQSNGLFSLNKNLSLLNTADSSLGVITKGGYRFIHDFAPAGVPGNNTFVGINSGNFTMSGSGTQSSYNTGIGYNSLQSLTTGNYNTAVGLGSLYNNTTGSDNTAIGLGSLYSNTTAIDNTALGYGSLYNNTTGNDNTAVGCQSLSSNTTGYHSTAVGRLSLFHNTTGFSNTAVGYGSLQCNTIGNLNTAVGHSSLYSNTTGFSNTAVGYASLTSNTTGIDNTAAGDSSLYSNSTGYYNIAVGCKSLFTNTTGCLNAAVGGRSLFYNTTGSYNTVMGNTSLVNNTTGNANTALGYFSLYYNTTGEKNTALGSQSLALNTGNNNTAVGYNAGGDQSPGSNCTLIGYYAQVSAGAVSNEITLGNGSVTSLRCAVQTITSLSDARDKKNIHDLSLGIDFLMKLKPRLFNWDRREWYKDNKSDGSKIQKTPSAGFIAQELDEVQTKENAEWLNLVLKNNPEKLEATPGNLLPVMVKAIQELKAENNELKDKLDKFERIQTVLVTEIEKLKSKDVEFKQVMNGN
jgi:hypothetical protein